MDYPRTHSYTYDASGNITDDGQREYVYLNGQPLAQVNAGSPETLTYLHRDHLGTPKFGTNAGGTQVWSWAPDAFGNGAPSGSVTVNIRMPGQYFDAESGLFYNWNRYYNPAIGRYISSDPIGLAGGINTFLYAAASPVMYIDPTGEFFWLPFVGVIGAYTLTSQPANAPSLDEPIYARDDLKPVANAAIFGSLGAGGALAGSAARAGCSAGVGTAAVPTASNLRLQSALQELFRASDKIKGGTAAAIRHELKTGGLVGGKSHILKGQERATQIERILKTENLSLADRATAQRVLQDLRDALAGK